MVACLCFLPSDRQQHGAQMRIVVDHQCNAGNASQSAMDLAAPNRMEQRTTDRFRVPHDN